MSLFPARLVFLAFIGLTGGIIYNALYLQDLHSTAGPSAIVTPEAASQPAPHELNNDAAPQGAASQGPALAGAPALPPVRTDLATPREQQVPEQLVKAVQRELDARGYNAGPPDGKLRDETRSAISSFEKDHGLTVTGMPADDLLREILLGDAVKSGAATGTVAPQDPDAASTKGERHGEGGAANPGRSRLCAGTDRRRRRKRHGARDQCLSARPEDRGERAHLARAAAARSSVSQDATSRRPVLRLASGASIIAMRLKSGLWVRAYLHYCQAAGVPAVIARRGDESAGAIFIAIDLLDGSVHLFAPAPAGLEGSETERRWVSSLSAKPVNREEADIYLSA